MALIGRTAPDFTAKAVVGDEIVDYTLSNNWKNGKYTILFFYPKDFTFVCPTEITAFSDRIKEFQDRNCEVVGCSTDTDVVHLAWKSVPRSEGGLGEVHYPLVADHTKAISEAYDVLHPDERICYRGLFLIDGHGVVRHMLINDDPLGRSINEAVRTLDALQFAETHGVVCPADWQRGEATITPETKASKEYFRGKAGKTVSART